MGDRPHHSEVYDANADEWINSSELMAQRDTALAELTRIVQQSNNLIAERDAALAERDRLITALERSRGQLWRLRQ